jgi:hypothetical protein
LNNQSTWTQTVVTLKQQVGDSQVGQILEIKDKPICMIAAQDKHLSFSLQRFINAGTFF